MLDDFPFYLSLIVAIVLLIMLAKKIKVAYPVLLVLAGLVISFIPGIPILHMESELIFIVFLPPLLYEAAWAISWKELWRWRRIISSFAFLVVFLSALSVALITHHLIPGFTLALGFLLGGIVSPPDAVSAGAILKFVRVPKRLSSILEGESLLNDASSLIIFQFALIAVETGDFIWYKAGLSFAWMLAGGVASGLIVGWIFMKVHQHLPTDDNTNIVLSIVTPYIMYIVGEEIHSSGVLAVVCGGLLLSNKRHVFLSSSSRLRGANVWESLVFVLNGLVFILIGLELPEIVAGLGETSLAAAIGYGILVTGVLIAGRILSAYGAVIVTLIARNFITVADPRNPGVKIPLLIGWTGMRGVVSLAAALSIPLTFQNGTVFPQRNLILFITFIVILLTLLLQGLTLPFLIKKVNMPDPDHDEPEEIVDHKLQLELTQYTLEILKTKYGEELGRQPVLQQMASKWELHATLPETENSMPDESKRVYLDLLKKQRKWLLSKNNTEQLLDEDIIRKHLLKLDLEEEKLRFL